MKDEDIDTGGCWGPCDAIFYFYIYVHLHIYLHIHTRDLSSQLVDPIMVIPRLQPRSSLDPIPSEGELELELARHDEPSLAVATDIDDTDTSVADLADVDVRSSRIANWMTYRVGRNVLCGIR